MAVSQKFEDALKMPYIYVVEKHRVVRHSGEWVSEVWCFFTTEKDAKDYCVSQVPTAGRNVHFSYRKVVNGSIMVG